MEAPVETPAKVKNPAKVAAGRRSAEIRKARETEREQQHVALEERLAQLEEYKLRIHDAAPVELPSSGTPDEVQSVTAPTPRNVKFDLTPWVIGGVGLAAVVYGVYRQAPVTKSQVMKPQLPAGGTPGGAPTVQLNTHDPFYME